MNFDIIVVGGGHAGIEAAMISAKLNVSVLLITSNIDFIGQMSCNPAIGGIAKGNIVREIDALGGVMAKIIDKTGIQFRMLNKSKGIAVWGNRAQADKKLYREQCRKIIEEEKNIQIFQGMVEKIEIDSSNKFSAFTLSGEMFNARAIILAMGTFLNGTGHIGYNSFECGRLGEPSSLKLSKSIQNFGINAGRLKTGTPARIDGKTVDYDKMEIQKGDDDPWPFSFFTKEQPVNRTVCWVIKTNTRTHKIIRENLSKSALYGGKIKGIGPRYCPSIEDKLVKFGERDGHTLFLEPEGLETKELYLNGFSTSLPFDIQIQMVQSLKGLENARIIRPAYAIEYDYFFPTQLYPTLESRIIDNLFFAGQINGTSGYEEAACQGLIAGINAVAKIRKEAPFILGRETSYIGVLIDDLITKGTDEPYRMFTARAEHRLLLRQDNADERLMPLAFDRGLISAEELEYRKDIWLRKAGLRKKIREFHISPEIWEKETGEQLQQKVSSEIILKRPGVEIDTILRISGGIPEQREILVGVSADVKYEGFIRKQEETICRQKRMEITPIPEDMDYDRIQGLVNEARMKLKKIRPLTIGQAARISGVSPSDINVLIVSILNNNKQ